MDKQVPAKPALPQQTCLQKQQHGRKRYGMSSHNFQPCLLHLQRPLLVCLLVIWSNLRSCVDGHPWTSSQTFSRPMRNVGTCRRSSGWVVPIRGGDTGDLSLDQTEEVRTGTTSQATKTKAPTKLPYPDELGAYFNQVYQCNHNPSKTSTTTPILGGTLQEALRLGRRKSRFVIVYLPASAKEGPGTANAICARNLLHPTLAKPLSTKSSGASGAFLVWSAKPHSPESKKALKRLQPQLSSTKTQTTTNKHTPILAVVYPAQILDRSTGKPTLVPKLLAQHHCNPPLTPPSLLQWLQSIATRHTKQWQAMRHANKERQYYQERHENYHKSIQQDAQRQVEEERQELEKQKQEEEARRLEEEAKLRREELLASLPVEPAEVEEGVKTVVVKLGNGETHSRRFLSSELLKVVFHWVEGEFGFRKEEHVLCSMNGKLKFEYEEGEEENVTLGECGLKGKRVGLRVLPVEKEEEEEDEATETEEDEHEEEEDDDDE